MHQEANDGCITDTIGSDVFLCYQKVIEQLQLQMELNENLLHSEGFGEAAESLIRTLQLTLNELSDTPRELDSVCEEILTTVPDGIKVFHDFLGIAINGKDV